MDSQTALELVKTGATLLFLDVPQYTLVAIDTQVNYSFFLFFFSIALQKFFLFTKNSYSRGYTRTLLPLLSITMSLFCFILFKVVIM
jgi:hypothetical protein